MSGMHLMPVYYTDTNLKKKKKRKVSASMQKAQDEHDKYLKKMGYVPKGERCYGSMSDSKPLGWGSIPCSPAIPTSDKVGNGFKTNKPLYTGNAVIGQAYNKGGLQVLSTSEIKDPMTGKRR
tara:strand:+ start:150 stop:515 length:366 start_codon:yes stop_codon:yes gene_type:complete